MHFVKKTVLGFLVALLCGAAWCGVAANGHAGARRVNHLTRVSSHGRIAVKAEGNRFSESAKVSLSRTRADGVKRRIMEGLAKKRRGGPRLLGAAKEPSSRKEPSVLAMYDISIESDGAKWQPAANEPVRVTVELDQPVTVKSGSSLGVVHLSDDGTVEELDPSRYGFALDSTKTAVTAFWFDATGFSVYAITETETPKTDSTPARRLYDFYSLDFNTNSVTWNQYVRRYFTTMEGNTTFRQIVKDGEMLVRPEVLPSPLGRTFMGWHLYDPAKANSTVDGVTYDAEGYATTKFDFTQPIVFNPGETGENEYVLRAVFDRVGYVIFHEQPSGEDWPITAVRRGIMREVATNIVVEAGVETTNITMEASVPISDVTVTYDDTAERQPGDEPANTTPRMIFRGWSTEKVMPGATTNVLGGPIELLGTNYVFTRTKNTEAVPRNLFPVFVNINWLAFSSGEVGQGATYIPPHFFYADEGTNRFPVPSRTGYTFEGWYTSTNAPRVKVVDANSNLVSTVTSADLAEWGGVISNGMLRLTKDTTLYANWTPAPTKYTVVVLRQSVEDDKDATEKTYDFAFSVTNIVPAESQVSVSNIYKRLTTQVDSSLNQGRSADALITTDDFKGFYYSGCDDTTTVKGNGTTVLRVYYDRYKVTYTFNQATSNYEYIPTALSYDEMVYTYSNGRYGANKAGVSGSQYYGLSNNQSIKLEFQDNYFYYRDGDYAYYYTGNVFTSDIGNMYGYYNNSYGRIYYVNNAWRSGTNNNSSKYTGTRYVRTAIWTPWSGVPNSTMTGLYGQPLAEYGYSWPIEYQWKDDFYGTSATGKGMTFLDSFNAIDYPRTTIDDAIHMITTKWYYSGDNGSLEIIHVLQDLDGLFKNTESNTVRTFGAGSSVNFTFTDKFEGFTVCGYTKGQFSSEPEHQVTDGDSESTTETLYVYHTRNKYSITFCDSYNLTIYSVTNLYYGAPLSAITNSLPTATPTEPSMKAGYSFTGWYSDQATSTRFNFNTTMPRANLIAHAGWGTEWYLIEIDPNGGELMFVGENSSANQSTWFWEPYNGEPIIEYTTVSRPFEESALYGTFFYAKQSRDYYGAPRGWTQEWTSEEDTIKSRRAYYTTNQSDPARVDDRRYRQAQNVYRYAGWYEQKEDGTEELYAFGQPVQKNTKLKLHWKHLGSYRLHFDVGTTGGRLSTGDENETILETLDASVYADSSEILVTRTAIPPEGYAFAGWRIRYGDDTIFHPGQVFLFDAAYTRDVPGPDGKTIHQLVLDAVYTQVKTVALTTDANGGTLDGSVATTLPLAYPDAPSLITNVNDSATQRTVSGMRNHAYGHLSDGTGYSCVVDGVSLPFLGWNTSADGTGTHFAGGQYVGVDTLGTPDENGRNILYAEWGVLVYFDKNNEDADWNAAAWPTNCVWDEAKGLYCQTNKLNGFATDPAVPLTSSNSEEMFRYWGIKRYSGEIEPYDFSTPITNASITLYGVWSNRIEVAVHAVDVTDGARLNKDADWLQDPAAIVMDASTYKAFEADSAGYATPDSGYAFAFACLCDGKSGHSNVSDETAITNVYYNVAAQHVYVTYADGRSEAMPDKAEIYFVYYQSPKTVEIGYKLMDTHGGLSDVNVRSAASKTATVDTDEYIMASGVTQPLYWAYNGHKYYAFAVGTPNATSSAQLHLITTASATDNERPAMRVKNAWNGYLYSLDDGANWFECGYEIKFYVVYFDNRPTIVTLKEKTLGTAADMNASFGYTVVVKEFTVATTESQVQRQQRYTNTWSDYGDPTFGSPVTNAPQMVSTESVSLMNGGLVSSTLSYSFTESAWNTGSNGSYYWDGTNQYRNRTNRRTVTETFQTITITQTPTNGFTTANDGAGGDQKYVYTYTTTGEDDETDQSVTFTNTRIADTIPVHVALGENGSVSNRDDLRTSDASVYTMTVTNGTDNAVTIDGAPAGFFTGDATRYSFMGIFYARTNENGVVTAISTDPVTSVTFAPMGADGYFGLYFNGDPENAVGDWELYAVYAEMPRIYYVREGANGALSLVDPLTYQGVAVTNMGFGTTTVAQGLYAVPNATNAFSVSTSPGAGKYFVPTFLDSLHAGNHLMQSSLAAGPVGATNKSAMHGVAEGSAIHLRVIGGILKWSADGATWGDFTGDPAVYVAYKEPGFDLTIVKASRASNADKAKDTFTFTITSSNLTDGVAHAVSGYSTDEVTPVNGVITLTMTNGSRVTIHALPDAPQAELNRDRQYEILEQTAVDYTLTNTLVNGYTPSTPVANGVQTILYENKTVEFTNIKSYTVTFVNEDGKEVAKGTYPYGTTPDEFTSGVDDPTKPMDATSIYRFDEWGPTFEPVGSNTTYTAEYKEIKIPSATQRTDDATNLVVTLESEQTLINTLKDQGIDLLSDDYLEDEANDILNTEDPNGLRRWENLVTGTSTNQLQLGQVDATDDTTVTIGLLPGEKTPVVLGYTVLYDLRRWKDDSKTWRRVAGPAATSDFPIQLVDAEGKSVNAAGYYRVFTLIVPNNLQTITNEIPAKNIIGVLEVNSAIRSTMTAVPWYALPSDPKAPGNITPMKYVSKGQLSSGDSIYSMNSDGTYEMWTLEENTSGQTSEIGGYDWAPGTTVRASASGNVRLASATSPGEAGLERGSAVWVEREVRTKPYFLVGQYCGTSVDVSVKEGSGNTPGFTMIANHNLVPLGLNEIDWGGNPTADDMIQIPTDTRVPITLRWTKDKSGQYKWGQVMVNPANGRSSWKFDYTIPAGVGVWYIRRGGAFKVTVPSRHPNFAE